MLVLNFYEILVIHSPLTVTLCGIPFLTPTSKKQPQEDAASMEGRQNITVVHATVVVVDASSPYTVI